MTDWETRRIAALRIRNEMAQSLAMELTRPKPNDGIHPDDYVFHMNNLNWVIDHLRENFPQFDALFPDADEPDFRVGEWVEVRGKSGGPYLIVYAEAMESGPIYYVRVPRPAPMVPELLPCHASVLKLAEQPA